VPSNDSSSDSWAPGRRRSAASEPSPEVPRPNSPEKSPSATTHTSADWAAATASGMAEMSSLCTSQPTACSIGVSGSSAASASSSVGI
jgi:hypothetical protein